MSVSWQQAIEMAKSCGFTHAALIPPAPLAAYGPDGVHEGCGLTHDPRALLPGAKSVLVAATHFPLMEAWPRGYGEVSAYYFTSSKAYMAIHDLADRLEAMGCAVADGQRMPQKPLAALAGMGVQGKNTLLHNIPYGTCMTLHSLVTDILPPEHVSLLPAPPCGDCRLCVDACPTGALDGRGNLDRSLCLRANMMGREPVPEGMRKAMGNRLLGCEICQRACPYNKPMMRIPPETALFALQDLLSGEKEHLHAIGERIGHNEVRKHRVLAQAALVAGNTRDPIYREMLEALSAMEEPAIREHARWALAQRLGETER